MIYIRVKLSILLIINNVEMLCKSCYVIIQSREKYIQMILQLNNKDIEKSE